MTMFPYRPLDALSQTLMPMLSVTLMSPTNSVQASGLVDSGAYLNVLPYSVGLALGLAWKDYDVPVYIGGATKTQEGRVITLSLFHPELTPNDSVVLAFGWAATDNVRLIFGQVNFFSLFEVCFYRSKNVFEVNRASP
jgi:hypothetical protein